MKGKATFKPAGLKAKKWRSVGHAKAEVNLLPAKSFLTERSKKSPAKRAPFAGEAP